MAKIVLKLEGFENLDVRFLAEFLYNLKVYTTALVEIAKDDREIANILEEIKLDRFTGEYDIRKIRDILEEDIRLKKYILEKTENFIERKRKYNVFHSQTVRLEIIDIRRGSWLIEFLLNLDPEQIKAFRDAISILIIFKIGVLLTLNKLVSNRSKIKKYVKHLIEIEKYVKGILEIIIKIIWIKENFKE